MNLKPLLSITLVLGSFLLGNCREAFADGGNTVQTRLEQMAQTYSHFSLSVIIRNQPLRLWPAGGWTKPATMSYREWAGTANPLAAEQVRLAGELRAVNGNRDALVALLNDANPKVRTLALGAIFQREDGRDLPLIAGLVNDSAETFPDLHDSVSSAGGVRPLAELETLQTVGRVAQVMLAFWQVPGHGLGPREAVSAKDFAKYWKKYAGRNYSASWFAVKMARATQQTTPIQRECRPDIHRVLAEMNALPMPDRALIQLYVLAPGWFESEPDDLIVSDVELIALAKKLRPNLLLQFLQGQKVSDDPDLDESNGALSPARSFILHHADELLRAKDASALLACRSVERDSGGVNPAWAIGAALVQPARASGILRDALAHETRTYEEAAGMLAGALWRIRGPAELDFLVHWFYTALPASAANMPGNKPVAFLWEVKAAARRDTKQLIVALARDSRFDSTDWETLKELLEIVNAGRSTALVKERDIYDARTGDLVNQRITLATWRNLLRRECGLPEKP